ncbi:MAG: hypothetical protein QM724_00135 [Flavobacteriales bacterium]
MRRLRPPRFVLGRPSLSPGSIDIAFDPRGGANDRVRCLLPLPDGRVLIGGAFSAFNGVPRCRVAMLAPDGSLDLSFQPEENCCGPVFALAMQPDGRLLVAGWGALGTPSITRLLPDGRVDGSFAFGTEFFGYFYALALLPDGRILVGGSFTGINGQRMGRIARLLPDGQLDASFRPGGGFQLDVAEGEACVRALALGPDGRILAAGRFHSFDGTPRGGIARLLPDGALDSSFDPCGGCSDPVIALAPLADGGAFLGGRVMWFAGGPCDGIVRLDASGRVVRTFKAEQVFDGDVACLIARQDASVIASGTVRLSNGEVYDRVVAFRPDGRVDPALPPIEEFDGQVRCMAEDTRGGLLVAGDFGRANGIPRRSILRAGM